MSDIAIRAEDLGKLYRIGDGERYYTLRDSLVRVFTTPLRWFRNGEQPLAPNGESRSNPSSRPVHRNPQSIWALKDVSFEVKLGEVIGIIGRNGAGKSTLLKILAEITEPSQGLVKINGRVGSLLEVGTGFHPELTGRENIYLNGAILGMKKAEIRGKFDEIVAFAEIEKFLDTPLKHYSSGMYMRLAFSVAAHLEPEILLVDEVLAVGDAAFQKKCLGKMGTVASEGKTVLFVSHNMAAMQRLCDLGLVLDGGQALFAGRASEAVETYVKLTSERDHGWADISQHPGRPHGMAPIIQSLTIKSSHVDDGSYGTIRTGEDVIFELQYNCGDKTLDYANIGICSSLGERILTVGTHLCPDFKEAMSGKGILQCYLPRLALAEGEYTVVVAMGTRTPIFNIDYVEDAMHFRVEFVDYFRTGVTLLPGQGYLAQHSRWHVIRNS